MASSHGRTDCCSDASIIGIPRDRFIDRIIKLLSSDIENTAIQMTGQINVPTLTLHAEDAIQRMMQQALCRRWKHLAHERIEDVRPFG
jgi:hypothetical protein